MTGTDRKPMTKGERDELAKLIRQRAKVDRANLDARRAELLADFEQSMATVYAEEDERFADLTRSARAEVNRVNRELAERCAAAGIPAQFAPSVQLAWQGRGENTLASRRAEFRKVAEARLDAMARRAKITVDERECAVLGKIVAHGLTTALGAEFLASMPEVGQLMQPLDRAEIEAAVPMRKPDRAGA